MKIPKMLLPYGDRSIIEKVIDNVIVAGIGEIILVVGSGKDEILKLTCKLPVTGCYNSDYRKGMFSSVKCGFSNMEANADAVLLVLGDQPSVGPDVIKKLVEAYRESGKGIVMPVFKNKKGHPVIIDSGYREQIIGMDESETLRTLIHKHPDDVYEVIVSTDTVIKDIDTQEDYMNELKQIR